MALAAALVGAVLIMVVLWEAFETIVLPRRVTRKVCLTRLFCRYVWRVWQAVRRSVASGRRLECSIRIWLLTSSEQNVHGCDDPSKKVRLWRITVTILCTKTARREIPTGRFIYL